MWNIQKYSKGVFLTSFSSVQFRSVAQSCPALCDPMNRSSPGLPVHHQLPDFIQTHVHPVSDAIQPSHPLSSPSPPAPNPSQHQSSPMSQLFAWGGQSTGVSALASLLPKKSQGWSPSEWTGLTSSDLPKTSFCVYKNSPSPRRKRLIEHKPWLSSVFQFPVVLLHCSEAVLDILLPPGHFVSMSGAAKYYPTPSQAGMPPRPTATERLF